MGAKRLAELRHHICRIRVYVLLGESAGCFAAGRHLAQRKPAVRRNDTPSVPDQNRRIKNEFKTVFGIIPKKPFKNASLAIE